MDRITTLENMIIRDEGRGKSDTFIYIVPKVNKVKAYCKLGKLEDIMEHFKINSIDQLVDILNEKLNNKSIKKKQNTKIRSFGIRTNNPALVHNLAEDLDRKLAELQEDGWKILSVSNTPCKEWDSKKEYFDSILFTIIAEISD